MKRLSLLLVIGFLALTACSAAPESEPAVATPEEATTEEATPESTAASALHRIPLYVSVSDTAAYDTVCNFDTAGNPLGFTIYKTDFAAGQTSLFYHAEDNSWYTPATFLTSDTLYVIGTDKLVALPLAGGEARTMAFDSDKWNAVLYNESYLYSRSTRFAPYGCCSGMRLDLHTGEQTDWNLPSETQDVMDALDGKVLTSRILTDYPLPFPEVEEQANAIIQNTSREYDLTDIATGQPVQTLATVSCDDLLVHGSEPAYSYMGRHGSDIYFYTQTGDETGFSSTQTVSVLRSDGTISDLGIAPTLYSYVPIYKGDEIAWIYGDNGDGTCTIYDTQGKEIGHNLSLDEVYAGPPVQLLPDGQLLLQVGFDYENQHGGTIKFALMNAEDYLNNGTEYTEMVFAD